MTNPTSAPPRDMERLAREIAQRAVNGAVSLESVKGEIVCKEEILVDHLASEIEASLRDAHTDEYNNRIQLEYEEQRRQIEERDATIAEQARRLEILRRYISLPDPALEERTNPRPTPAGGGETRACTCHPSEAPVPCPRKYAFSECIKAAAPQPPADLVERNCNGDTAEPSERAMSIAQKTWYEKIDGKAKSPGWIILEYAAAIDAALAAERADAHAQGVREGIERAARRCELEASRHGSLNAGNVRRECAYLICALVVPESQD